MGQFDFAASRQDNVPNFTEDVVLVTVTFKAGRLPKTAPATLALQEVKLGAKGGVNVPADIQDLTLKIVP
jgi:hypothetical protein